MKNAKDMGKPSIPHNYRKAGDDFTKPSYDELEIGQKYHVSWAYRGARFKLMELDPDGIHAYLDNPKYKRKKWLKVKVDDLRDTRNRTTKKQNTKNNE